MDCGSGKPKTAKDFPTFTETPVYIESYLNKQKGRCTQRPNKK